MHTGRTGVPVPEGVCEVLGVSDRDIVELGVGVALAVYVSDAVCVWLALCDCVGELVCEALRVTLGVCVWLGVSVGDKDPDWLALGVCEGVAVSDELGVCEHVPESVELGVVLGDDVDVVDTDCVSLGVRVGVRVDDAVVLGVSVDVGLRDIDWLGDGVRDGEGDDV